MLDRLRLALMRRLEVLSGQVSPAQAPVTVPADIEPIRAQGNAFIAEGNMVEAEACFRAALKIKSDDTPTLVCLGFVLKEQHRLSEARVVLRRAIDASKQAPDEYEMHYLLGQISEQQGDLVDAAKNYRESLRLNPDFSLACKDLCQIHETLGESHAIRELLIQSVALSPNCADYRVWLADVCESENDFQGIVDHLTVAVSLGVRTVHAYRGLGGALCRIGKVTEGMQTLALAEAIDPKLAYETHFQVGFYHLKSGNSQRGLYHMQSSIALRPDVLPAHSAVLMTLSYAENGGANSYSDAAKRFSEAVKSQITQPLPDRQVPDSQKSGMPGTKLRVGFVSGDLCGHPVGFFLNDVVKNLDRTQFHLVAYSNTPAIDHDRTTESLKVHFDTWCPIRHLSDDAAAALVASHNIDILFDLGGHTGENRLAVFARRPAPTQVTWLGYWASTGLEEMDYIIGDPVSSPLDTTEWFSEKVYRLPHSRLCMEAPKTSREIAIAQPPGQKNAYITFGSFQQARKTTDKVLSVWAKIMAAVPQSRLRIQTVAIGIPSMRDRITQDMTQAGIDLSRVDMFGASDLESYLEAHNEVDVLLDTFPYPGGTTTAFALWMGVPTVTLAGNTMLSRQGASMLSCVGLTDLIAHSEAEYVETAVRLAGDTARLAKLRNQLRADALKSPLFDAKTFAADFQTALFQMHEERMQVVRSTPGQAAPKPLAPR